MPKRDDLPTPTLADAAALLARIKAELAALETDTHTGIKAADADARFAALNAEIDLTSALIARGVAAELADD